MKNIILPKPTLIFVGGGPGTGKSTLMDCLIPQINDVCLISKDAVGDPMLRTHLPGEQGTLLGQRIDMDDEFYKVHLRDQIYYALLDLAIDNVSRAISPFIEGNYTGGIKHGYFQNICFPYIRKRGFGDVRCKMLFCYAPPKIIVRRIMERGAERDARKTNTESALMEYIKSHAYLPRSLNEDFPGALVINTSESVEENSDRSIQYLTQE